MEVQRINMEADEKIQKRLDTDNYLNLRYVQQNVEKSIENALSRG